MRRKWDEAKTPYERLKLTGALCTPQQEKLDQLHEQTNPRALRNEIYKRLAELWKWQSESEQGGQGGQGAQIDQPEQAA